MKIAITIPDAAYPKLEATVCDAFHYEDKDGDKAAFVLTCIKKMLKDMINDRERHIAVEAAKASVSEVAL